MNLRKTDLAYLAGFFDGEGSIMLSTNPGGGLKIAIACSQNTQDVLLLYVRAFGGHVYSYMPKNRRSLIFQWRANGLVAIDSLKSMKPWLLIKLLSCEEALNAWEAKQKGERDIWLKTVMEHQSRVRSEKSAR